MSGNSIACAKGLDNLLKEEQDEEGHFLDVRCLATIDTTKFVNDDNPNSVTKYAGEDFFIKFLEHKMKREALGYDDINAQIVDRTYFPLNFPLIRLEDVMLMYAEIVGPTSKGVDMIDRIRRLVKESVGMIWYVIIIFKLFVINFRNMQWMPMVMSYVRLCYCISGK